MSPIKFASSFFLIVLLLAACSSPSPTPTQTSGDTGAPTATPITTSTEAEEPTATSTSAIEELEIVEYLTWIDPLGDYRVEMLVRNPNDHPVWVTNSWTRILDASDQILVSGEIYIGDGSVMGGLGHILPGETVPAISCLTCSGSGSETLQGLGDGWADNLTIGFDLEYSLPLPYSTDFEVRVDSFSADYSYIEGAIKYTGNIPVSSAFIRFLFYDQDGHYVGWGEGQVTGEYNQDANNFFPIATDTWLPFSAFAFPAKAEQGLDYEVTVIGDGCLGLVSDCQEEMLKTTPQN
jgi:hypothetical protein